jgi:hypothetical protein
MWVEWLTDVAVGSNSVFARCAQYVFFNSDTAQLVVCGLPPRGPSPCAPTNHFKVLAPLGTSHSDKQTAGIPTNRPFSFFEAVICQTSPHEALAISLSQLQPSLDHATQRLPSRLDARPHPRTSFHHQPEAQHPKILQLSTRTPADYPILTSGIEGRIQPISATPSNLTR